MIVFISSNFEVAKKLCDKVPKKIPGLEFCGIEAEWGNNELTEEMEGVSKVFNHHGKNENIPAALAFEKIYFGNYRTYSSEYFIISHIDVDTIFGIGWVSGIFPLTKKLMDLSRIFASLDINGYHNLKIDENYKKEFTVIMGIVSHAKKLLKKVKFQNYYNCTPIILKTLVKINSLINNEKLLNERYNIILKEENLNKSYENLLLKESDNNIHIFNKKINDFNNDKHSFIVSWNLSLSIYGRDKETVKKYIPEGLPEFLNKISPESGGQFTAAGTKRKKEIPKSIYLKIINELKIRISMVK